MSSKLLNQELIKKQKTTINKPVVIAIVLISLLSGYFIVKQKHKQAHLKNAQAELLYVQAKDADNNRYYDKALKLLNQAIAIDKEDAEYFYLKAQVLNKQRKWHEARISAYKAIKLVKENAEYWTLAAALEYILESNDNAIKFYQKAIELDPDNSSNKFDLSVVLWAAEKQQEAIELLRRLTEENPEFYDAWNQLGAYLFFDEQLEAAYKVRKQSVKQFREDAFLWYWHGMACERVDRKTEAIAAFKKAMKLDPAATRELKARIAKLTGNAMDEPLGLLKSIELD